MAEHGCSGGGGGGRNPGPVEELAWRGQVGLNVQLLSGSYSLKVIGPGQSMRTKTTRYGPDIIIF
jgi:hypothetical protein